VKVSRKTQEWVLPGLGTLIEIEDHGLETWADKPLYQFHLAASERPGLELFVTPEHALASMIAAKYTGERGAGGTGVGTAADWFMKMIGAEQLVDAGSEGRSALIQAMIDISAVKSPFARGSRLQDELEKQGYVIAKHNPA
jgi:hypothetical protein